MQIAHCMHLVLDYEHNTDDSRDSTHYQKYDTINVEHLIIGVTESILSIAQPIMAVSHTNMNIAN